MGVVSTERVHIGFFGMRNVGKSSLVNAVTNQNVSIVSDVKGTTTDPVRKTMELLPIGPVVIIDTPGIDDEGMLGEMRVERAKRILASINVAVLVADATKGLTSSDNELLEIIKSKNVPYIIAYNKADLIENKNQLKDNEIYVSAQKGFNIYELKEKIGKCTKDIQSEKKIVSDLLNEGDTVVLVIPIDESAPKGRLILPQQQTMRDLLDAHCNFVTCQDTELAQTLGILKNKPKMVITDSQAFEKVSKIVPEDITLTSFSILFARYKGNLEALVKGAAALKNLKDGSKILISEGCTHHRQCNDIGTVKMPKWIENYSGAKIEFDFTSGGEFPSELDDYDLVVHCGGCMITEKEMHYRLECAENAGVPIVNYGVAISQMNGILQRSLKPFPEVLSLLK